MTGIAPPADDSIDLADAGRAVRAGWPRVLVGIAVGLAAAAGTVLFFPPRWNSRTTLLVRDATDLGGGLLQRTGANGAGQLVSSLLGGKLASPIQTEIALLESRVLVGEVVDSLRLQCRVTSPRGVAPARILAAADLPGPFKPFTLTLESTASGIRARAGTVDTTVALGGTLRLPQGSITLAADSAHRPPPTAYSLRFYDREEAITRAIERLAVDQEGGEVVSVTWGGDDSVSAPAAANLLAARYLARRRVTDRGINRKRLEFVSARADTLDSQINAAARRLRAFQDSAQLLDPETNGKAYLDALTKLRYDEEALVMEASAVRHLLQSLDKGEIGARQLAAYPAFLRSAGINDLLGQLYKLETERVALEQTRNSADPSLMARVQGAKLLEAQLTPLARTYAEAVERQRQSVARAADSVQGLIARLPGQAEESFALQNDLERLTKLAFAVQGQRVEMQLAAMGEGGEAMVVDRAEVQRKPTFPPRAATFAVGGVAGLLLGVALALWAAYLGAPRTADDVARFVAVPAAESAGGAVALPVDPGAGLVIVAGADATADTRAAAEAVAATLAGRGVAAGVVVGAAAGAGIRAEVERLRAAGSVAVAAAAAIDGAHLAPLIGGAAPVVVVAAAGRTSREAIRRALRAVERTGHPCAGVLVQRGA